MTPPPHPDASFQAARPVGPVPPAVAGGANRARAAVLGVLLWTVAWSPGADAAGSPGRGVAWPDYSTWGAACRRLPSNRELGGRPPPRNLLPLPSFAEFDAALGPFLDLCRTGALARADAWLDAPPKSETFLNLAAAYYLQPQTPFQPFAARHEVPAGTRLFFHGDLHGDIHSLLAYLDHLNREGHLDGFRVTGPELRLVFLGDYTDRGHYGVEVLYTLFRLKLASPDQVLLVRGNHEDVSLVAQYGFLGEATAKYGKEFDVRRVVRLYDFLPAVLYLASGTNVLQCNHGGLEPGYQPGRLLEAPPGVAFDRIGRLEQRRWLAGTPPWVAGLTGADRRQLEATLADFVPQSPTQPAVLGFLWNDFTVVAGEPQFAVDPGRALVYGDQATASFLVRASAPTRRVRAIFRGHQHAAVLNPLMSRLIASRGVFRHWQTTDAVGRLEASVEQLANTVETAPERAVPEGSVWTFNVSPDSVYGAGCGFTFDTAGELRTAERWEDWRLRVLNVAVAARPAR